MRIYKTIPMWVVTVVSEARPYDRDSCPVVTHYYFNEESDARAKYKEQTTHQIFRIEEILYKDDRPHCTLTRFAQSKGLVTTVYLKQERIPVATDRI